MPITSLHPSHPLTPQELTELWAQLHEATALTELGLLAACLGTAWLLVRLWRGRQADPSSIWFGHHVYDGILFPALALLLAVLAKKLLLAEVPLAVFRIAIPVLVSLAIIRLTVKVFKVAFPQSHTVRLIERTVSWLAWGGMVLWVTGILPLIQDAMSDITWKVGATQISLRNLVEGTFNVIVVLILSLSVSSAIEVRLLKGATENLSLRKITANLLRASMLTVGVVLALSASGIDLTALSVLGGAVGVGIGFGLQKLAANYVSGFVILAERSLRIGDLVMVDGFEGRITDINTRYTVLRSVSGRESIVPNEMLISQRVENASLADTKLMLVTEVQVAYGTNLDELIPTLVSTVSDVPRVLPDPGPSVLLSSFGADGLGLTISFWIDDPHNGQMSARSAVNMAVLATLNRLSVEIPYPQRVVRQLSDAD